MKKLITLLSLVLLASCNTITDTTNESETATGPIKIGYIGPLTGNAANYGNDTLNGATMAVADWNAKGGIDGATIELIAEDGTCGGAGGAAAAQKLIHVNKVVAIVGGQCSSETLAAAPISNAAKIVQISPVSSSPDVTDAGDFIFRTYPSDLMKGIAMAQYAHERDYEKVVIITENTDYAVALHKVVVEKLGDKIIMKELMEPDTKDFRAVVSRLKNMDFDLIIPNGQTDAFIATLMQQIREQGFKQPAVSQDIADSQNLATVAGEAVEGMQMFNTSSKLGGSKFAKRFRSEHGEPKSNMSFAVLAYDAADVLFTAIEKVGINGPSIRDFFYDLKGHDGIAGTFSFDKNGDVEGIPLALKEFKDGKIVEIEEVHIEM